MEPVVLGERRELFWDEYLMESAYNIKVTMHKPVRKNVALRCDAPWDGNCNGYSQIIKFGSSYRLYYRASDASYGPVGKAELPTPHKGAFCVAESADGKTFTRPDIGHYEVCGTKHNNVFYTRTRYTDNFSVFYDDNPACPYEERFKALTCTGNSNGSILRFFVSQDGISFEDKGELAIEGTFDTLNTCFFDTERGEYLLYFRYFHNYTGNSYWTGVRDIRVCRSKDFSSWSVGEQLIYNNSPFDYQLYTNGIYRYGRAPHMLIGKATRYAEKAGDSRNFLFLPDRENRMNMIRCAGRSGTAMTDAVLITSRDGLNFRRTDEAFMTPGVERSFNWYYGDAYLSHGDVITSSDIPGGPDEISFYVSEGYRVKNVEFIRYSVRLDGYFSWHADYSGGSVLSLPLVFSGDELSINFETSALGNLRIYICDEAGCPLGGYDSGNIFGNSVSRPVIFEKPLSALSGKTVRMRFEMSDCELYSMKFSQTLPLPVKNQE